MAKAISCEIPDHHPARLPPPIVYLDTEGRPWRRIKNLKSESQSSGDFERYAISEAQALLGLGAQRAQKLVYP